MFVYPTSPLIKEPRLLTPGKQPLGPCALNYANSIVNGMMWCIVGSQRKELVGGFGYNTTLSNVVETICSHEQSITAIRLASINDYDITKYTMFMQVANGYRGSSGLSNDEYIGKRNTTSGGHGPHFYTGTGFQLIVVHGSTAATRTWTYGSPYPGRISTISAVVDCAADTCEMRMDGGAPLTLTTGGSAQSSIAASSNNYLRIGASLENMAVGITCGWNRMLTLEEVMSLHRDPYQVVVAA